MPNTHRRSLSFFASVLVMSQVAPATAHAQDGPRWRAWLGCWSAVASPSSSNGAATNEASAPILCVTPTSDADVVEISAVADGKVASRDRLDASGRSQAIDAGGCTGTTRANWSGDGRRVFLHSSVTCQGQPSETSAILAMAANGGGEWIDVRSVTAGGNSEVRVARYRDIGISSAVPQEIANALRDRELSVRNARVASTAPLDTRDIIEASRSADAAIVEAWLLESGQRLPSDAATLRSLADAGVPGRVTDALVSASRAGESSARYASDDGRIVEHVSPAYDPWGYGAAYTTAPYEVVRYRPVYRYAPIGFNFSLFGFGYAPWGYAYAPFGYYPYAYRPVAYVPFFFGFGYTRSTWGRGYRPPVVIVRPGRGTVYEPRTAHPRSVSSQGYTQARTESYRDATPRTAVGRSARPESGRQDRPASQPGQRDGGGRSAHGRH